MNGMLFVYPKTFILKRGEDTEGQIAVAHVTLNRVEHKNFPDTVVVLFTKQRYGMTPHQI